jgi:3-deoxy-D-manno-octulosonate 8-phosphate phosphatase (KDO 8-P phosphatase)
MLREGVKDKYAELVKVAEEFGFIQEQIAYMGDDLNDLPAFKAAGFTFSPQDAVSEVLSNADCVVKKDGGRGAVRFAIEMILKAQNKWEKLVASYLESGQGDKQ